MENPFDAVSDAIAQANAINRAVDRQSNQLASLLVGRLRQVSSWTLKDLKKELARFNSRTGKWMD